MNQCDNIRTQIVFYLDDELQASEVKAREAHLIECDGCRELVDNERRFFTALRGSQPLSPASPELRARVERVLSDGPSPYNAPAELRVRIRRTLSQLGTSTTELVGARSAPLVIGLVTIVLLIGVNNHQRHLRGQLPLETTADAPEEISDWFAGKVPFRVTLPNYQESSGQEKLYELEGARLVGYRNDYA